jgi:hypothetical protein
VTRGAAGCRHYGGGIVTRERTRPEGRSHGPRVGRSVSAGSRPYSRPRDPGSQVHTYQYKTPGGTKRTMCVVNDTNDYIYSWSNYGRKGIITAFWINGHHSTEQCNSSPG